MTENRPRLAAANQRHQDNNESDTHEEVFDKLSTGLQSLCTEPSSGSSRVESGRRI